MQNLEDEADLRRLPTVGTDNLDEGLVGDRAEARAIDLGVDELAGPGGDLGVPVASHPLTDVHGLPSGKAF